MNFEPLHKLSGLITPEVGEALYNLALAVPATQAIVEVGSFRGKSTSFLAAGARDGKQTQVFAVDAWDTPGNVSGRFGFADPTTYEVFEAQLRSVRLWSRVTPLKGFSRDVAAEWTGPSIGLLFIDADHQLDNVRSDFDAWSPYLAKSGHIAFDDLDTPKNPGVRQVVDSLVADGWKLKVEAERLAVLRR